MYVAAVTGDHRDDRQLPGISAAEAARRLGIKPQTLYAYVSRGLLSRERVVGRRESRFDEKEVARLAARQRSGGGRAGALEVIVDSSISLIASDDTLWYRGWSVEDAAGRARFEDVALWLWASGPEAMDEAAGWFHPAPEAAEVARAAVSLAPAEASVLDRYFLAISVAASADPTSHSREPDAVRRRGARIIGLLVDSLPDAGGGAGRAAPSDDPEPIAARLWPGLSASAATPGAVQALNSALVLLADHELASSTLAARVAASTWADIYRVLIAGLAACGGTLHGGAGDLAAGLLGEAAEVGAERAVGRRMRNGELVPGFGHTVYRERDPRCRPLLDAVRSAWPDHDVVRAADDVLAVMAVEAPRAFPNVDFALAALVGAGEMINGAAEAIFCTARCAGWIAHGMEESQHRLRYRARAAYTGPARGAPGPELPVRTWTAEPTASPRTRPRGRSRSRPS